MNDDIYENNYIRAISKFTILMNLKANNAIIKEEQVAPPSFKSIITF